MSVCSSFYKLPSIILIWYYRILLVGGSILSWWGGLSTPGTLRAIPAVAYYWQGIPCWTGQRVGVRRRETPKTDVGSSVISSDLKHRANDARDGSSSCRNRRDQSGLNGCCTAMWKANGKTTKLSVFLDSLFPETEIPRMRDDLETGEDTLIWRRKL
jgi:hypothetical protein